MSLSSDLLTNSKLDKGRVTIANTYIYGNDSLYKKIRKPKSQKAKKPRLNLKAIINKYAIIKRNNDEVNELYDDIIQIDSSQNELEMLESEIDNLESNIDDLVEVDTPHSEEEFELVKDDMIAAAALMQQQIKEKNMNDLDEQLDSDIFDDEEEYAEQFLEDYDQDGLDSDFDLEDSEIFGEDTEIFTDEDSDYNEELNKEPRDTDMKIDETAEEELGDDFDFLETEELSSEEDYEEIDNINDDILTDSDVDLLDGVDFADEEFDLDMNELDLEDDVQLEYNIDELLNSVDIDEEETSDTDIEDDSLYDFEEPDDDDIPVEQPIISHTELVNYNNNMNITETEEDNEVDLDSLLDSAFDNDEFEDTEKEVEIVNNSISTGEKQLTNEKSKLVQKSVEYNQTANESIIRESDKEEDSRYKELLEKQRKQQEELEALKEQLKKTSDIKSIRDTEFNVNKSKLNGTKTSVKDRVKATTNDTTSRVNNIAKYSQLDINTLYKYTRHFMIKMGVQKKPIDEKVLKEKFGEENINKLLRKSYLIKTPIGITIGR